MLSIGDANYSCTNGEVSTSVMDQDAYSSDSKQEINCLSSDEEQVDHPEQVNHSSQEIVLAVCQPSVTDDVGSCDIGSIITPSKSIDDIYQAMKHLDNAEKYSLLLNHVQPPAADHLPSTRFDRCNRKFRV